MAFVKAARRIGPLTLAAGLTTVLVACSSGTVVAGNSSSVRPAAPPSALQSASGSTSASAPASVPVSQSSASTDSAPPSDVASAIESGFASSGDATEDTQVVSWDNESVTVSVRNTTGVTANFLVQVVAASADNPEADQVLFDINNVPAGATQTATDKYLLGPEYRETVTAVRVDMSLARPS